MKVGTVSYDTMGIRKIKKQVPTEPKRRTFPKILFALFLIVFFVTSAVVFRLYLDCRRTVEEHLKSQTWALPSTIYADAPILYEGMPMNPTRLVDYLERLDYQSLKTSDIGAGQFQVQDLDIRFRKHSLYDDSAPEPPILIHFARNSIEKILNLATGEDLPAYELEPIAISNLFGQEWEKRTLVKYKDLPKHLVDAVVAIEDRRFYEHGGVDLRAILRAVWNDLNEKNQLQGASTITQQLVKNFYLTPERSIRRKIREAIMAWIMESKLNKQQILELYLNEIYLGQRGAMSINGVGEASRLYFRKDVQRIDVPEAALLAGMIQAPNIYNPYRHPEEAKSRRDTVLKAMQETGAITSDELKQYSKTPVVVYPFDTRINLAPYFGSIVKTQLLEKYDQNSIYTKNLRIFTTLDLEMQQAAEEAIQQGLAEIDKIRFPKTKKRAEACLIAIEPQTGYIRALVGGRSFSISQFDRVKQAKRQPGSVFKPVVYAEAFEQYFQSHDRVFTPATLVDDGPWTLHFENQVWQPKNYDGQYHGVVTLRDALAHSMNIATAKLAMEVGLDPIAKLGKTLGFDDVKPYPSIALGAFEVSPWQVATAYTVFANGGVETEIRTIKKVADTRGKTLERSQIEVKKILHPQTAYLITDMLTSVLSQGTGAAVRRWGFTRPAAGKTGTTDEYRDAWFVGYTPNLLCVVWTGYDDNTPIKMTGAQAALPIWVRFMKKATQNLPEEEFSSPHGVVVRMIDPTTGGLATEDCPEARPEFFIDGTEPTEPCKEHGHHWWSIFG
jgi:penicillin-binding protein 1B